jgi:hypothetical protein
MTKFDEIIDRTYPAYRREPNYAGGKDICGYFPLYEKHLPERVDNFLEIGIAMGISIKMFRDYYKGMGEFHALNMDWGNAGVISKRALQEWGVTCHEGNQADVDFLKTIKTQFDVIIDDGSHRSDHQITTFRQMFEHNLKPGGLYIVEDLHCCLESYWWGEVGGFEGTLLYLLLGYDKTVTRDINNIFAKEHPKPEHDTTGYFWELGLPIKKVYLYNPSIAFIFKQ